ncbi:hypothetical protein ABL850_31255 [Variovorax paradoxus]|uniref:hypothetical protein n=1 Tax=Variovorax paradoxus TaxID=34073 RepID=UPI0012BB6C44|nr:hypothetical protein [Variovorax paradoxus]
MTWIDVDSCRCARIFLNRLRRDAVRARIDDVFLRRLASTARSTVLFAAQEKAEATPLKGALRWPSTSASGGR